MRKKRGFLFLLNRRRKTMLIVNRNLYPIPNSGNIYSFIEASINALIAIKPELKLKERKEFWLFYYIKEDYFSNLASLFNADIDFDFLGFPFIRRNTRHAVEAFLDLYNLCRDENYIEVLSYCAGKQKHVKKYGKYCYKGQFTIQSKCNIAKSEHGMDFQKFVDVSKECNAYVHPNTFMETISIYEKEKKEKILKELLNTNFDLLVKAYCLMLDKFNQNIQPYLGCLGCYNGPNCYLCYREQYNLFYNYINGQLLVSGTPNNTPNNFYR